MTMVLEAFEQSNGFSALTADELFFVNGGSDNYSRAISFTPPTVGGGINLAPATVGGLQGGTATIPVAPNVAIVLGAAAEITKGSGQVKYAVSAAVKFDF
ncbi:MAG: hypothetical protein LBG43_09335 [Treponema sp.]|jgi:hypothetical protein|nr:hypothetical protein [Treponema sp.]